MRVVRAYTTELDLNHAQMTACKRHAGAARYAYNWGLAHTQDAYKATGISPSAIDLHHELNARKQTELSWMYAVSTCAPQEALRTLDSAFAHFYRRCALTQDGKRKGKLGYAQRKTKKQGLGSFRLTGTIVSLPEAIRLPRLGRVRLKEHGYLPTAGVQVLCATGCEQAGHWYVAVQVEQAPPEPANRGPVVGVALGVKALATLSDGTVLPNSGPLKRRLKQHTRVHRAVSRKHKGSTNRYQAARRLARHYRTMAHQRANTLQQVTTRLAKTTAVSVIEDRQVAGRLKNHHLAQAIGDVGFSGFGRQLLYQAAWYGSQVVVVSRWEPSSKTCSGCGWVDDDLTLGERLLRCERLGCDLVMDRDLNAASNLRTLAGSSSESAHACGVGGAGRRREALVHLSTQAGAALRRKQEPNPFCASA